MTQQIGSIIQASPEILVFLSMALGYAIGRVKIRGFGIGTTASVLLTAMVLGQFGIEVPSILKSVAFALFAFCIGYQVGPQFFGALRKEGMNYLWVSVVVAMAGLACAVILGRVLHFDQGTTAGLFAGAMTQSAAIGTANGAVEQMAITAAHKQALSNNIAVAYAITYLFGVVLALVPIVAGMVFGRYVLKMNPVLLLGALTGARVIPQAMIALEEDADSTTPALGFAAPFAFANVFLTIMGSIIINVM